MRIADLPTAERPRERLAAHGPGALADRELLAVLLGTGGAPGVGAHLLAERLLARFGSLAALGRARPAELARVPGVGAAKAAALCAAFELSRRAEPDEAATTIRGTGAIVAAVRPLLRGRDRERLVAVLADQRNRVLDCEIVAEGAADRCPVPVREVIVAALRRDARALALAHNHPGGDLTPSPADLAATRDVSRAAQAVGLRFLDHVIVTESAWRRIDHN